MDELTSSLEEAREVVASMVAELDQALGAEEVSRARMRVKNAMAAGEEMEVILADSAFDSEDHAVTDEIERALRSLREFFALGVEALSGDPMLVTEKARLMRPLAAEVLQHVEQAAALQRTSGTTG